MIFDDLSLGDFVERYRAAKTDPKSKFINTESLINQLGYILLGKKRNGDAVEVLRLNTEFYPDSANAYDRLGEALAAAGRADEAIKSYEKAVALDPNIQTSIDAESLRLFRFRHLSFPNVLYPPGKYTDRDRENVPRTP